jgi:hypothetical protein
MIASVASDTIVVSTNSLTDFRSRQITGERSLLQDSTPTPAKTSDTGGQFAERSTVPEQPAPAPAPMQSGSMFAAAVIAGALAPTPQTIEEVYARIGSAWIPPESELRLRDLSV